MRISREWLSDYVEFDDLDAASFSEVITTRVAEVDGIETVGDPLDDAILCKITSVKRHPSKENLQIASVATGNGQVDVVCGAPNCSAGSLAAFVPAGGRIYADGVLTTVESREVAGVASSGVLLSEAELGISSDHSGLFIPAAEFERKVGAPLASILGRPDTILVIDNKSLTHRPDLWSHFGFAREIAAVLRRPLKREIDRLADDTEGGKELLRKLGPGTGRFSVKIDPGCSARRYAAVEIEGLKPSASPLWLRRRLHAVGAGVRNVVVDLSNYVMHDIGQPNHAFDSDRLEGQLITVRNARSEESFFALDGMEYRLSAADVVIADSKTAIALGGVIGGGPSAVTDSTSRILLESANFDPTEIRLTAKRHNVRTDAAMRFEKSQSPYSVPLAIHRYVELITKIDPAARVSAAVADAFPSPPQSVSIPVKFDYVRSRLGASLTDGDITGILTALRFAVSAAGGTAEIGVPYYRATRDISIADDIVEEVGRINGYENIPESAPLIAATASQTPRVKDLEYQIRDLLAGLGFSEVSDYSFSNPERCQSFGFPVENAVVVENALDSTESLIRTSLIPGLTAVAGRNARFRSSQLFFEIGRCYSKTPWQRHGGLKSRVELNRPAAYESRVLGFGIVSGKSAAALGQSANPPVESGSDLYAAFDVVRRIAALVGAQPVFEPVDSADGSPDISDYSRLRSWMHPFRAAKLVLAGRPFGVAAEVHPNFSDTNGARLIIGEIDLEVLLEHEQSDRFEPLSKYPVSLFELSAVMPEAEPFRTLEQLLRGSLDRVQIPEKQELLRDLELVAVYRGKPLKDEEKSVSVKLSFGAANRTLSSAELTEIQERVMEGVKTRFALRQ